MREKAHQRRQTNPSSQPTVQPRYESVNLNLPDARAAPASTNSDVSTTPAQVPTADVVGGAADVADLHGEIEILAVGIAPQMAIYQRRGEISLAQAEKPLDFVE